MLLVQEKKDRPGVMEVLWQWLPFFVAADGDLIKETDKYLQEKYSNKEMGEGTMKEIHEDVIGKVILRYPLVGMEGYIRGLERVEMQS